MSTTEVNISQAAKLVNEKSWMKTGRAFNAKSGAPPGKGSATAQTVAPEVRGQTDRQTPQNLPSAIGAVNDLGAAGPASTGEIPRGEQFAQYAAHGWKLVPIPPGLKGPEGLDAKGWNKRENCKVPAGWAGNVGLAHAYSGTCALDIDDFEAARVWLAERGIDLQSLLDEPDAVGISSGRPGRAKLLYRLAEPLRTKTIELNGKTVLELRCAAANGTTVQDVLPPSIHPDTGKPYVWTYGDELVGDWRDIPPIPPALAALWRSLITPAKQPATAGPVSAPASLQWLRELAERHDLSAYKTWYRVGMVIHHETQGSAEGLALWDELSSRHDTYGKADRQGRVGFEACAAKWESFGKGDGPALTVASLNKDISAEAEDFEVIEVAQPPVAASSAGPSRFRPKRGGEFVNVPALAWIIKGVLPHAELAVVYGESGSGKTFVVLDMACSIARGEPWRGLKVKRGRVVYIVAEGAGGFRQRSKAYARHHSIELDALPLTIDAAPNFLERKDAMEVAREIIAAGGADVIVVDTLAATAPGGDENSAEGMGKVVAHCKGLHAATGALVILIHHSGKDASRGARGWSGLRAAADAELEVTRIGDSRQLSITKMKDGEDSSAFGFKLLAVPLGLDEDGDLLTSCVVEHCEATPPGGRDLARGKYQIAVCDALEEAPALDGWMLESAIVAAVLRNFAKPEGRDTRAFNVRRAVSDLQGRGIVELNGERVRLVERAP